MLHRSVARSSGFGRAGRTLAAAIATAVLYGGLGCGGGGQSPSGPVQQLPATRPTLTQVYRPTGLGASGAAFVHLFMWTWTNIASECENVLGPAGWKAVQVAPPQEHIVLTAKPWWVVYQPVSYSIGQSRQGTRAEFVDMVQRCKAAGVDVYVDAVINHMTAGGGTGSNGTVYSKYNYPGLWNAGDFHPACGITDYQNAANVQDCELVGLADLFTESTKVRQGIANYLLDLARIGVAGFRIDAAKHMQPVALDSIVGLVNTTLVSEARARPYWFGEVIDNGGEAVKASDYFGLGYASGGAADITEFKYRGIGDKFAGVGTQRVADLATFSPAAWGLMPSDKAVTFIENHDTQRGGGLSYRDGAKFRLGTAWLLAYPYGYPSVLSGYGFNRATSGGRDAGPPHDASNPQAVACAPVMEMAADGQFVCEHRDSVIARMVKFRKFAGSAPVGSVWTNGSDAMAFSRGTVAFVAMNNGTTSVSTTIPSALPPGSYCDLITGSGGTPPSCAGRSVTVAAGGGVTITLAAGTMVALTTTALP